MTLASLTSVYIPAEWRQAIARGIPLPQKTSGSALFADISGFTPLTEALTQAMGRRRGAEELPHHLNQVYNALISEVHRYGGSVIGFAGDAITCWFAGESVHSHPGRDGELSIGPVPPERAAACAVAIQQAMGRFARVEVPGREPVPLAVKVAIASGPARRFVVGDPDIQLMASLAGQTIVRMASAEHLAGQGEIVTDAPTVIDLGERLQISEWRAEEGTGERFAVVAALVGDVTPTPWSLAALDEELVRPWVLSQVHARLQAGLGEFLTELRPAVALFLRFEGIDYDTDVDAGAKLNAYVCWVQRTLARRDGTLIQLTVGDKGSYLYAAFGAPVAHGDDALRAVRAAWDLSHLLRRSQHLQESDLGFVRPVQIGISQGTMRTGAYGGKMRRTYGVLGDQVNLAARLMQHAKPGEVIASQRIHRASAGEFSWELLPAIKVKGRAEPVAIARLVSKRRAYAVATPSERPLVGRETEMAEMMHILERALAGHAQIVWLTGDAGAGKSRLAAELGARAREQGVFVCQAMCQSDSRHAAYSAWRPIFRELLVPWGDTTFEEATEELLGQDVALSNARQIARLEARVDQLNPEWRIRLPVLGDLLDLPIPDNATTAAFGPRLRQEALFSLAVDVVQRLAREQPLLLLLDDAHWMDEASWALTLALGRAIGESPVLLMLVQRPNVEQDGSVRAELQRLPCYHQLDLPVLSGDDLAVLITRELGGRVSPLVLSLIRARSRGNPFFAEELVDALKEAGALVRRDDSWALSDALVKTMRDANCLEWDADSHRWSLRPSADLSAASIDIPDSIQGVVLARLDRLPELPKLTLKVASVIGRTFELKALARAHRARPGPEVLRAHLALFEKMDFTQRQTSSPRTAHMFKCNVTHAVVYETLLEAQRRQLHWAVGGVLESLQPGAVEQLAYHFSRSDVRYKTLFYIDRAARKAQRSFANQTALAYYNQALAVEEHWEWRQGQIEVLHILGRREEERAALETLEAQPDVPTYEVAHLWGQYHEAVGDYDRAQAAVERALAASRERAERVSEANALAHLGLIARRQGDYARAIEQYQQALAFFHEGADYSRREANAFSRAFNGLGIVHRQQGDFGAAQACYEQALALSRQSGNRMGEAEALNGLGANAYYQRDFAQALDLYRQALDLRRSIGDRTGEGTSLFNLAAATRDAGDYAQAEVYFQDALSIHQATGNRWEEVNVWNDLGVLYQELGNLDQAEECLQRALHLSREIGDEVGQAYVLGNLALVTRDQGALAAARRLLKKGLLIVQSKADRYAEATFLSHLGAVDLRSGRLPQAIEQATAALKMRRELDLRLWTPADLATLAGAHLASGNVAQALHYAEQALAILDECGDQGPESPQRAYFVCYQVLAAADRSDAARAALRSAYDLVMARAAQIADTNSRMSFLERVAINQRIVQEARDQGIAR